MAIDSKEAAQRATSPASSPATNEELLLAREQKLAALRALGVNPFRNGHAVGHTAAELRQAHGERTTEELAAMRPHGDLAGRIVAARSFGKAGFLSLRDRTGELQAYVKRDRVGATAFEVYRLCDVGDVVAVAGPLFRTRTGELSVEASTFTLLTKSLRPLPEKWHGLADIETRYRQRYLDLIANPEVAEVFRKRSKLIRAIRAFLDDRDFLEVETPMMQPVPSGAVARPFETHHNALDLGLYLRIAPELYLKKLVVGGFERVYELGRNFRNEGLSSQHNPEFTMVEFYQAHATYEDLMDLAETLLREVAVTVTGGARVTYQGHALDFGKPFRRVTMQDAVRAACPGELLDPDADGFGATLVRLFEERVEATLIAPTFVTQHPTFSSPLARKNELDPRFTDRFELFIAGREIGNAFSELNDPADQRERFEAQALQKGRGDLEAMDVDHDYLRALEQGMPPTAGMGIGIDRLTMLLTDQPAIRDVILFPLMKPERR